MNNQLSAEQIAHSLDAKPAGAHKWKACCPAHSDKNPSFSITDKDGKALFKCWSGCTQGEVIEALVQRGLWSKGVKRAKAGPSTDDLNHAQMVCIIAASDKRKGLKCSKPDAVTMRNAARIVRDNPSDTNTGKLAATALEELALPDDVRRAKFVLASALGQFHKGIDIDTEDKDAILSAVNTMLGDSRHG